MDGVMYYWTDGKGDKGNSDLGRVWLKRVSLLQWHAVLVDRVGLASETRDQGDGQPTCTEADPE